MRADRLVSLLLLLQRHGKMSARTLAFEMGTSTRTIYRDIQALSTAGVPVYMERGSSGGCCLVDGYRTTLTGMTDAEIRALFLLSIPEPLKALDAGQDLSRALSKVLASVPGKQQEKDVRQRILLDWSWWLQDEPPALLQTIYMGVMQNCEVCLVYQLWNGVEIRQDVKPYGLIGKGGAWHLVCAVQEGLRLFRVIDLLDATLSSNRFERRPGFNLAQYWQEASQSIQAELFNFRVDLLLAETLLPDTQRRYMRNPSAIVREIHPMGNGWAKVVMDFDGFETARVILLGFGGGARILSPEALRLSVIDFARQSISSNSLRPESTTGFW